MSIPTLVAHRGYMENYPENTLTGIEAAIKAGACMVEFDVQMNTDSELVLLHDDNFHRTAGIEQSVFENYDSHAISVHEPDRFDDAYKLEPLPTLAQALELLAAFPDVTAFVEIKDESLDQWGLSGIMDVLLAQLQHSKKQCVLISDSLAAIIYTQQASDIRTGWVTTAFDDEHRILAEQHAPDYLICNYKKVNGELWQGRWQWMLYDITEPEQAMEWAGRGAQLIETRDIGGMLQHDALREKACL